MHRGKLIVLYGVNNLGKTTQAEILVKKLKGEGRQAAYLKYPVYDLEPSGVMLNEYLRAGNPVRLTAREAQLLYAFNRAQYQPKLEEKLASGIFVVAEDYWGTGVAWGVGAGVDEEFLLYINQIFHIEDLALLFRGQRFQEGIERNHLHEQNPEFTRKVAAAHEKLAKKFGWVKIEANQDVEKVSSDIWGAVKKVL